MLSSQATPACAFVYKAAQVSRFPPFAFDPAHPKSAAFAPAQILREEGPAPPPLSALPPVTVSGDASGIGNTSGHTSGNTSASGTSGGGASKLITDPTLIAAAALKATAPNAAANAVNAVKYAANAEREAGAASALNATGSARAGKPSVSSSATSAGIIGASPHRPGASSASSSSTGGSGSGSGSAGASAGGSAGSGGLAAAISMAAARRATRGSGSGSGNGSGDDTDVVKFSAAAQKMLTPPLSTQIEVYAPLSRVWHFALHAHTSALFTSPNALINTTTLLLSFVTFVPK